jgi:hypothetical protein
LYQKALATLAPSESALDPNDIALDDLAALVKEVETLDLERPDKRLLNKTRGVSSQASAQEPSEEAIRDEAEPFLMEEVELPITGEPEESTMDIDTDPEHLVPLIPNLQLPPALSLFNFGLLTLVDFPSQPVVPVCLVCRKVIKAYNVRSLQEHFRDNHDAMLPSSLRLQPFEPTLVAPIPTSLSQDEEEEDEEMMADELPEGFLDRNDELNLAQQEDEILFKPPTKRYKFEPLNKWWADFSPITTFPNERPPTKIPAIPFLVLFDGHGCPVQDCPFASRDLDSVKRHLRTHQEEDTYLAPLNCKMQSLHYRQDNSSFFSIIPPPESVPTISIQERMYNELVKERPTAAISGIEYANAFMLRFKYSSIYPGDVATYNAHAAQYIVKSTILHDRNQELWEQLLALGCFAYAWRMHGVLTNCLSLYQRILGFKLP